jgi:hypothetical protein
MNSVRAYRPRCTVRCLDVEVGVIAVRLLTSADGELPIALAALAALRCCACVCHTLVRRALDRIGDPWLAIRRERRRARSRISHTRHRPTVLVAFPESVASPAAHERTPRAEWRDWLDLTQLGTLSTSNPLIGNSHFLTHGAPQRPEEGHWLRQICKPYGRLSCRRLI